MNTPIDIGIARRIGSYGDAIEVPAGARWLLTSGTPGLPAEGPPPEGISAQADLAWRHILAMLDRAGMSVADLVKVNQYLTRESDIAEYARVRARHLGAARPASMLAIVPALVRPEFLVEIEVIAAAR